MLSYYLIALVLRWQRLVKLRYSLQWRHNEHDGVLNHGRLDCLFNRLFRRRSKKTSKLRVNGLCVGNSPVTSEIPAQRASNAENVSIWWRHHVTNWLGDYLQFADNVTWNMVLSKRKDEFSDDRETRVPFKKRPSYHAGVGIPIIKIRRTGDLGIICLVRFEMVAWPTSTLDYSDVTWASMHLNLPTTRPPGGLPSQRVNNAESLPMSWRRHAWKW